MRANFRAALHDIVQGVRAVPIWSTLGWQEIRQRYRRSALGPFWLTLSTGAMLLVMGPLYGRLLGQDIGTYFPYLAVSLVVWQFLATLTNDACQSFIVAEGYIKNLRLPLTVHVMRFVWRNLIIFAHNLAIIAVVLLVFPPKLGWHLLEFPVAIALIVVNAVWLGLLLGTLCTRFRDVPPIVASVVQIAFFLTPVLWSVHMLGRNAWAATVNPFFHFLEIARQPVLGASAGVLSWAVVLAVTVAGYAVTLLFFARFRSRVAYWA